MLGASGDTVTTGEAVREASSSTETTGRSVREPSAE